MVTKAASEEMNVYEVWFIHFVVSSVLISILALTVGAGLVNKRIAAITTAMIAATLPPAIAYTWLDGFRDRGSWAIGLAIPIVATLAFCLAALATNRLTASVQIVCFSIVCVVGLYLFPLQGFGIVFLWVAILMALSMSFVGEDLRRIQRTNWRRHHPTHAT